MQGSQGSLVGRFRGLWLGAYGALALYGGDWTPALGRLVQGLGGLGTGRGDALDLGLDPPGVMPAPAIALGLGLTFGLRHHDDLAAALHRDPWLGGDRAALAPWREVMAWGVARAIAADPSGDRWLATLAQRGNQTPWGEPVQGAIIRAQGAPLPPLPRAASNHGASNALTPAAIALSVTAALQAIARGGGWALAVQTAARTGGPLAALWTGAIAGSAVGEHHLDLKALLALDAATTATAIAQGNRDFYGWAGRLDPQDAPAPPGAQAAIAPFVVLAPSTQVFRRGESA